MYEELAMKRCLKFTSIGIIVFALCFSTLFAQQNQKPYKEEEVSFRVDDVTLSGTLTIPKLPGQHPVVILISGSGADNRDADVSVFKCHYSLSLFQILEYKKNIL